MAIYKLIPAVKGYLWGGERLRKEFSKTSNDRIIAESWELSNHPDGRSQVIDEDGKKITLDELIRLKGNRIIGSNYQGRDDFPVLIKLIDARDNLSVQVHPDEEYAREHENQHGKTEMWHIIDADNDSFIYYGVKNPLSETAFEEAIKEGNLEDLLNKVNVKPGENYFIPSGTIHAIGKGCLIAEIQQNSNVTYRIYDFNRLDKDGKPRELHIKQALEVSDLYPIKEDFDFQNHIGYSESFLVDELRVINEPTFGLADHSSFVFLLVLDGNGIIKTKESQLELQKGDSVFIEADTGAYELIGDMKIIKDVLPSESFIAKKKPNLKIGIDLGGTMIKTGLVNDNNEIIAKVKVPTESKAQTDQVILNMIDSVGQLLKKANVTLDDCLSLGIGAPGTIDTTTNEVVYSNNFNWRNIALGKMIEEATGLKVKVRNDASTAALGEALAGNDEVKENVILFTLGTGVGSGIIMDGKIFEGHGPGGAELGHMVIKKEGETCTCGRKGCLEAYASASALERRALLLCLLNSDTLMIDLAKKNNNNVSAKVVFEAADLNDKIALELLNDYFDDLSEGVINAINIFRPEAILIGGGLSAQGDRIIKELKKRVTSKVFGGESSYQPEIALAKLGNDAGIIGAANI